MITPGQARKLIDCYYDNRVIPNQLLSALRDLARQVEELQADKERLEDLLAEACHARDS